MEYVILTKVGMVIGAIVKGGYILAGSYFVKTGIKYISDYKDSVEKERVEVK